MGKVMDTLQEDASFAEHYARARRIGIELHIDGLVDLSDTANEKNANAVRIKVDVRKWIASKILPKVYGDKLGVDLQAEVRHGPAPEEMSVVEIARRAIFTLNLGEARLKEMGLPEFSKLLRIEDELKKRGIQLTPPFGQVHAEPPTPLLQTPAPIGIK